MYGAVWVVARRAVLAHRDVVEEEGPSGFRVALVALVVDRRSRNRVLGR